MVGRCAEAAAADGAPNPRDPRTVVVVVVARAAKAAEQQDPFITVEGTEGRAVLHYTRDELTVSGPEGTRTVSSGRTNLLENLIAARRDGAALLCPLAATGAFMRVLDAVRTRDPALLDHHNDDGNDNDA